MALLGNFIGNALGMQSAEEYTQSVEAASRLRELQRKNQFIKDRKDVPVTNEATDSVSGLKVPDAFNFDDLKQPPLKNIPPPAAEEETVEKKPDTVLVPKKDADGNVVIQTEDGSLADAPTTELTDPFKADGNTLLPPPGPELPAIPTYRRNQDNTERNAEIAKRNQLQNTMTSIMSGAGIKRKGGMGTQNVTREQGEAYKWWTSEEAFRLFYNNPQALELAKQDPVVFALEYIGQKDQRVTSTVVPESASRTEKLITGRIDGLKTQIGSNKVQQVYKLANEFGIDPFAAIAIFGIESDFGRAKGKSAKGAVGGMQVMPAQFERLKKWFADPANLPAIRSAFTLSDGTVNEARVQYAIEQFSKMKMPNPRGQGGSSNPEIVSGLAQLVYNKAIGLPKNLWGAGYQANANKVLEAGRPLNVDDGNISNSDYNRAYVTLYNHIASTYGLALSEVETPYGIDLNTIKGSGVGKPVMVQAEAPTTTTQETDQSEVTAERDTSGLTVRQPTGGLPTVYFNGQPLQKFETQEQAEAFVQQLSQSGGITKESVEVSEKAVTQSDDVNIEMFVNNPSSIPITTQRILDARKMMTDSLERNLAEINRAIDVQNRRAAEFTRLAQIARRTGQLQQETDYLNAAEAARTNATNLREQGLGFVDTARKNIYDYDNTLLLAQGAQALSDLSYGSTARAGAVLSAYSGYKIEIVPRSDGKYDMVVEGDVQATFTKAELADKLQSAFDGEYRKSKQARIAKRQDQIFEKNLDTAAEIKKLEKELAKDLALEQFKGRYNIILEQVKNSKAQLLSLGDGKALIKMDNDTFIYIDPRGRVVDPESDSGYSVGFEQRVIGKAEADALLAGSGTTQGGDPYKTN
jgi:hypothetical protein